jgi:hypothetical protein
MINVGVFICLICFGILTVKYFIDWKKREAEFNSWLVWLCAFFWCLSYVIS